MNKVFTILYVFFCVSVGLVLADLADSPIQDSPTKSINNQNEVGDPELLDNKTQINKKKTDELAQQIDSVNKNVVGLQTKVNEFKTEITNQLNNISSSIDVLKKRDVASSTSVLFTNILCFIIIGVGVAILLFMIRTYKSIIDIRNNQESSFKNIYENFTAVANQLNQIGDYVNKIPSEISIAGAVESRWKEPFASLRNLFSGKPGNSESSSSSINPKLNVIDTDINNLRTEVSTLRGLFENYINKIKKDCDEQKAREIKNSEKLNDVNNQVERAKLEQKIESNKAFEVSKKQSEQKINELSSEKEKLQKDIKSLQDKNLELEKTISKLESSTSEKCKEEYQKGVDSQKKYISEQDIQIGALQADIKHEKESVEEKIQVAKRQTAFEYDEKINVLKASVKAKEEIIADKENSVNKALQDKVTAEKISEEQKKEIGQLKITINNKDQIISQSQQDIDNIKRNVAELEQSNSTLKKTNEDLQENCSNQANEINQLKIAKENADKTIDLLQNSNYPSEFVDDEDFTEPKNHLDQWINNQISGAHLVRASLNVVASRSSLLDSSDFYSALHNISLGISTALYAQGLSVSNVIEEFKLWNKFISKYSDDVYDFQIQIPQSGAVYDDNWMCCPKNKKIARVTTVKSWACFSQQWGCQKSAGVE